MGGKFRKYDLSTKGDYARTRALRIQHLTAVNPCFFCFDYRLMSFKE